VLASELRPGDVVIWDRVPNPQGRAAAAAVRRAGAKLIFLSPYCPDYTPIEELWSKVKTYLRRVAARSKDSLYSAPGELESVTQQDIVGWFQHAGLCATQG
jgi:transposase